MSDESGRVFEVVCKGCSRSLMMVERLRDPEIGVLEAHLRACCPPNRSGTLLRWVR